MKNEADIPVDPRADDCVAISRQGDDVDNILTVQKASKVAKFGRSITFSGCRLLVLASQRIDREILIVAEGVQLGISQESGMMD